MDEIIILEKLTEYTWIFALTLVLAFALAFAMGANDVANSFATSVGSGVLTLKKACIIAAFTEFGGAVLLGGRVTDTIRKGIADPTYFEDNPVELMLGMMCATASTALWLMIATYFKLPVSSSHSVVSAIVGFTLVSQGTSAVDWWEFGKIAISWVISPILAGIVSLMIYFLVKFSVLMRENPFEAGLRAVPIIYAITLFINLTPVVNQIFKVVEQSREVNYEKYIPLVSAIVCGLGVGIIAGLIVAIFVVPRQRKKIAVEFSMSVNGKAADEEEALIKKENEAPTYDGTEKESTKSERPIELQKTEKIFHLLQVLTASFESFVHGSNDVSNAVGPLAAVYSIWQTGIVSEDSETSIWILAYGGVGIVVGLFIWGSRVIETMGTKLTEITPSRGFTIEIGAAFTVLVASRAGIPVSTTHCKVGSIVFVGYASNDGSVSWKLFGKIILSWIATIPFAAAISSLLYFCLNYVI